MSSTDPTKPIYRRLIVGSLLISTLTLAGCVSRSDYDNLQTQNQQLQTQNQQLHTQICRLQGAIKYTVNGDLLFPPGSYEISDQGQQLIGRLASQLAPFQQNKLVVNGYTDNAPIGAQLRRQGIDSNQMLSQKRADNVMQFLISQGVKQDMISAVGHGEDDPVASNSTAQGRAQNRRVELTLANSGCSS